jgi:mRNA-degrading endonuclease RelE of RelBE toxin-antitoxin system
MPWDLLITKPAERDLRALGRNDRQRVNAALEAMRSNPFGGDIKFLKGTAGALRRRVLFDVDQSGRRMVILGIKRRTSTTY